MAVPVYLGESNDPNRQIIGSGYFDSEGIFRMTLDPDISPTIRDMIAINPRSISIMPLQPVIPEKE